MTYTWNPDSQPREDGPDALREWRWRSYTEYLEDLGYDLDGGGEPDVAGPPEAPQPGGGAFRRARRD